MTDDEVPLIMKMGRNLESLCAVRDCPNAPDARYHSLIGIEDLRIGGKAVLVRAEFCQSHWKELALRVEEGLDLYMLPDPSRKLDLSSLTESLKNSDESA